MPAFWLIAAARAARVAAAAAAAAIAVTAVSAAANVIALAVIAVSAAVIALAAALAVAVVVALTDNRSITGDERTLVAPHQRRRDRGVVLMQVVSKSLPTLTLEVAFTWAASDGRDTHFGSLRAEASCQLAETSQQTSH